MWQLFTMNDDKMQKAFSCVYRSRWLEKRSSVAFSCPDYHRVISINLHCFSSSSDLLHILKTICQLQRNARLR